MVYSLLTISLFLVSILQSKAFAFPTDTAKVDFLLSKARSFLDVEKDADAAFEVLAQVYQSDPNARGLNRLFESCFRLRIDTTGNVQDRFGLASLLLDQERYEEASKELRAILDTTTSLSRQLQEKASSMLFRTNAACCQWETFEQDCQSLVHSLTLDEVNQIPIVHPFDALKWPCVSLKHATKIASLYARRTVLTQGHEWIDSPSQSSKVSPRLIQVSRKSSFPSRTLNIGYISPDFTSLHPLAFLMQDVFRHHNRDHVKVKLYSLSPPDNCLEVNSIRNGSDSYVTLSRNHSAKELAEIIRHDHLDVLIDLCGYAGTTLVAEILSHRPSPIQVSYMGFPGSTGAPYLDYIVCDPIVVPTEFRQFYTERMIWMPHCYFVNSHKECVPILSANERLKERQKYGFSKDAFVFCCHSRADKIDPAIFATWMNALVALHDETVVLWLLQSGRDMETNLRHIAEEQYGLSPHRLIFCDIVPRNEHLRRLGCADVFLDTPAYNAHTLGCDALWAGVPMISLLRPLLFPCQSDDDDAYFVSTEKLSSRVGASLLTAAGLDEWIVPDLPSYQAMMVKAATQRYWFDTVRRRVAETRWTCPLFDTQRWAENLELALREVGHNKESREADIQIMDS
jgi:protein O-GlcNAc transferase